MISKQIWIDYGYQIHAVERSIKMINYKSIGHLYGSGWPVALGHCCNCQVTQVQPTAPATNWKEILLPTSGTYRNVILKLTTNHSYHFFLVSAFFIFLVV
jgi:hypothetical protein